MPPNYQRYLKKNKFNYIHLWIFISIIQLINFLHFIAGNSKVIRLIEAEKLAKKADLKLYETDDKIKSENLTLNVYKLVTGKELHLLNIENKSNKSTETKYKVNVLYFKN